MTALLKTIEDTYHAYYTTNDANGELYKALDKLQETVPPKMFLLAEQEPRSQAACDVFTWTAMKSWGENGTSLSNRFQSLDYLTKCHSTNAMLGPLCRNLGHYWSWRWNDKPVVAFLQKVAKENPKREIRAQGLCIG